MKLIEFQRIEELMETLDWYEDDKKYLLGEIEMICFITK